MTERIILGDNDVISMNEDESLTNCSTSKVSEIKDEIIGRFGDFYQDWTRNGKRGEALSTKGNGWVKGKVRIEVSFELEFIPNKLSTSSESPLSDLREQLNP